VGEVGRDSIVVSCDGHMLARGELVVWRGALGVRITET
jgi:flagellar motor switch/type III secretory pathway protein FliN